MDRGLALLHRYQRALHRARKKAGIAHRHGGFLVYFLLWRAEMSAEIFDACAQRDLGSYLAGTSGSR